MFNQNFKIYLITNKINNKQYVGITKNSLEERFYYHCHGQSCRILSKAIKKYGSDNFTMEVIFYASTLENMVDLENYFIIKHNTLSPNGYNLREGGKYGKFTEETKLLMSVNMHKRWKNLEKMIPSLSAIQTYIENKQESILGVNIRTKEIIRFLSINNARNSGFSPAANLSRKCRHDHNYLWFYDEGFSDQFYIDLAEVQLVGFNTYKKNSGSWNNQEHKSNRIELMIHAAKKRAKPLIAINKTDFSILEFPSVNDALKKGYKWGNIRQSLTKKCKHAYNYVWFYKTEENNQIYVNQTKKLLE